MVLLTKFKRTLSDPNDYQMFFYDIMRYSARLTVAEHGFESVTLKLAEDFPHYKATLACHGIPISERLITAELREIQESGYNPAVVRSVLEAGSSRTGRQKLHTPVGQLTRTLAELELVLDTMASPAGC